MQQDFPSIQDDMHVVVEVVALRPTVEFPEAHVVVIVGRRAPAVHVVVVVQGCLVSGKDAKRELTGKVSTLSSLSLVYPWPMPVLLSLSGRAVVQSRGRRPHSLW
jgi:hypothetical protein